MVPVTIETLVVGMNPSPSVVVLRPSKGDDEAYRVLPIWIGPAEAVSIGMALEGASYARPTTHDLTVGLLEVSGAKIDRVEITRVEGSTFFASVVVVKDGETTFVDARPSDSIALAIRVKAPIFVDDEVMDSASFPYAFAPQGQQTPEQIEQQLTDFSAFVENLSPEDFNVGQ